MATRTPFTRAAMPKLSTFLKNAGKRPITGLTQGGSSRKGAGAKVAATDGKFRPKPTRSS